MVVKRSDQRRRRVVIDGVSQQHDEQKTAARKPTPIKPIRKTKMDTRIYSFSAHRRNQLKTTDLIPKRFISCGLVVLALLTVIAILNVLAHYSEQWGGVIGASGIRSLSLTGAGSLSGWFSSFLLIMTGLASLQIYALRQHRCDDYRGTYRLWLWMALIFIVASIHCVVNLGAISASVVEAVTGRPVADKLWPLLTFKMVALTMLVVRGIFEVRESRGSLAMVVIVWVAFSAATLLQIPALKNSMVLEYNLYYGNIILFATTMLLLTHFTYARFVYLNAHGLTKTRVTKKKSVSKAKTKVKTTAKTKAKTTAKPKVATKTSKRNGLLPSRAKTAKKKVAEETVATAVQKSKKRPPVPKPSNKGVPPVPKPSKIKSNTEQAQPLMFDADSSSVESSPDEYAKMNKSQRRRQRKLEKRARRAA